MDEPCAIWLVDGLGIGSASGDKNSLTGSVVEVEADEVFGDDELCCCCSGDQREVNVERAIVGRFEEGRQNTFMRGIEVAGWP